MIYGVSHGEACPGVEDPGLTDNGWQQAFDAGDELRRIMVPYEIGNEPLVLTSPMNRARETAEGLGFNEIRVVDSLAEVKFGLKSPKSPKAAIDLAKVAFKMPFLGDHVHTEGHDSWYDLSAQAYEEIDEAYQDCEKQGRALVAVTHRGILRGVDRYLHRGQLPNIPGAGGLVVGQLAVASLMAKHGEVSVIEGSGALRTTSKEFAEHH